MKLTDVKGKTDWVTRPKAKAILASQKVQERVASPRRRPKVKRARDEATAPVGKEKMRRKRTAA
jgi:hypothetical protein